MALGATTLAALNEVEGISVQVDPFAGSTLVAFEAHASGNVATLSKGDSQFALL